MNITYYPKTNYNNFTPYTMPKNKPNSNPICKISLLLHEFCDLFEFWMCGSFEEFE